MIVKNTEKKEDKNLYITVESGADEFENAVKSAYQKNKGDIYIQGFRKGKAPRSVIEGMYGHEVFYSDAIDELAPAAFEFAITSENIKFVGRPSVSDVKVTDERTAEYVFCVQPYPEVVLGQYKGLEVERLILNASDEDVDKEIDAVLRRNARMLSVDDRTAQMGDTAYIDYDGYLDGERFDGGKAEGHSLELGSGSFVPGFEEQIVGMAVGEEKDINITFPENYYENLAGKDVVFKVKLNSLTVPELPELDDEFAKDVSEFDTLAEYRADVKQSIQKRYDDDAENYVKNQVIQRACDNMTVEIPDVMIQDKIEEMVRNYASNYGLTDNSIPLENLAKMLGLDDEILNGQIRPSAEMQVKSELLIDALVKAENISVSDEEAEEYLAKFAESVKAGVEEVRQYFGMDMLKAEKIKDKAVEFLVSEAVISDVENKTEEAGKEE